MNPLGRICHTVAKQCVLTPSSNKIFGRTYHISPLSNRTTRAVSTIHARSYHSNSSFDGEKYMKEIFWKSFFIGCAALGAICGASGSKSTEKKVVNATIGTVVWGGYGVLIRQDPKFSLVCLLGITTASIAGALLSDAISSQSSNTQQLATTPKNKEQVTTK